MTEARQTVPHQTGTGAPHDRVWVLDDPRAGTAAQAIGIAERLGMAFRRLPLSWNWMAHAAGHGRAGSLLGLSASARRLIGPSPPQLSLPGPRVGRTEPPGPELVISAGRRSAAVALWLKARHGSRIVHCLAPELLGALLPAALRSTSRFDAVDLLVVPAQDRPAPNPPARESPDQPPPADHILTVLGAPHRLSPLLLHQQANIWHERLAHLPHPRVALLLGGRRHGSDMPPAWAHALGRRVARLAARRNGAVLASTSRRTGREATEALAAGLAPVLHLLYRWGEPGENPYLGFLATADIIVVTADSLAMLGEACATGAAVYVALPELAGPRERRLIAHLIQLGQVRPLDDDLAVWPRASLDESGRVAAEILRRFPME